MGRGGTMAMEAQRASKSMCCERDKACGTPACPRVSQASTASISDNCDTITE